jgi:hypothetical protein
MLNTLIELQEWYQSQCDGEWEHQNGVRIDTLDNPGWSVSIDVSKRVDDSFDAVLISRDNSESDWIFCNVKDQRFTGACDPTKLDLCLNTFLKWSRESLGESTA